MRRVALLVALALLLGAGDAHARRRRRPPKSAAPARVGLADPLLGLKLTLPAGWVVEGPMAPMNAMLFGPRKPPFRSNISILLESSSAPLPAYLAELARKAPDTAKAVEGGERLRVAGKPAVVVKGAPDHPKLKLKNVQAIIDAGDHKVLLTGTALADRFDELQNVMRAVLDTLDVTARAPLAGDGVPFRDLDGRFTFSTAPRFEPAQPRAGEVARLVGPVEAGMPLLATVEVVPLPGRWSAPEQLAVRKRPTPGEKSGMVFLDGKVLKRPGGADALETLIRYLPAEGEVHELCVELPVGKELARLRYRGPADGWALYDAALRKSAESLIAPAGK